MTPYKRDCQLTAVEKIHNKCLSSDRVVIEHTFGILKGRWKRLAFIDTYNISKAIEIVVATCILHNFCIFNNDQWEEIYEEDNFKDNELLVENQVREQQLGKEKRSRIARHLSLTAGNL